MKNSKVFIISAILGAIIVLILLFALFGGSLLGYILKFESYTERFFKLFAFVSSFVVVLLLVFYRINQDEKIVVVIASVLLMFCIIFCVGYTLSKKADVSLKGDPVSNIPYTLQVTYSGFAQYHYLTYLYGHNVIVSSALENINLSDFGAEVFGEDNISDFAIPRLADYKTDIAPLSHSMAQKARSLEGKYVGDDRIYTVLGDDYYTDDTIVVVGEEDGNGVFFIPKTTYEALLTGGELLSSDSADALKFEVNLFGENSKIRSVMLLFLWFIIGALFLLSMCKSRIFAVAAFPVGVAVNSFIVLFLLAVKIKITAFSLSVSIIIIIILLCYLLFLSRPKKSLVIFYGIIFLAFIPVCIYAVTNKMVFLSPDSISGFTIARYIAVFGDIGNYFSSCLAYGMLTSFATTTAFVFSVATPYYIYPIFAVCLVVLLFFATYKLSAKKGFRFTAIGLSILSSLFLVVSDEFRRHIFWPLNNMPVGFYLLLFVFILLLLADGSEKKIAFVAIVCASIVIITRAEGAIYISFIILVSTLLDIPHNIRIKISLYSLLCTIFINFLGVLLDNGLQSMFWSPKKGLLSVFAALTVFILCLGYKKINDTFQDVGRWWRLFTCTVFYGVAVTVAVVTFNNSRLLHNFDAVQYHLFSYQTALLLPVLVLLPILALQKEREASFGAMLIAGYILLTVVVFAFREEPLWKYYGDSSNRVLLQLVPSALLVCLTGCAPITPANVNRRSYIG